MAGNLCVLEACVKQVEQWWMPGPAFLQCRGATLQVGTLYFVVNLLTKLPSDLGIQGVDEVEFLCLFGLLYEGIVWSVLARIE